IILLRLSGKRTLTKLNVFDFVFVVALGSTLATTILSEDVTLASGMMACFTLLALQYLISWTTNRSRRVENFINGQPSLLFQEGKFLKPAMRRHRITESEIMAAIRGRGLSELEEVHAVVLETDGTLSVLGRKHGQSGSALRDLAHE